MERDREGRTMTLQDALAKIPLLLSYATMVLACSLILTSDPVADNHSTASIWGKISSIIAKFVLLPSFISAGVASCLMGAKVMAKTFHSIVPLVLFVYISVIGCYLGQSVLGSIQVTCYSLLAIKYLTAVGKSSLGHLSKCFGPLILISLAIGYFHGGSLQYMALLKLVFFVVLQTNVYQWSSRIWNAREHTSKTVKTIYTVLVSTTVISFVSLYGISYLGQLGGHHSGVPTLNYLMIFVFFGCLAVFSLSIQDILGQELASVKSNDQSVTTLPSLFHNGTLLATGLMAVVLKYLSFDVSHGFIEHILMFSFVTLSEFISRQFAFGTVGGGSPKDTVNVPKDIVSSGSLFSRVIGDKDTRSIFSFLLLNSTFMFVQLLYSFRSKSLGLLSDSLHMALDCTSLLLGLIAAVLSKGPATDKFPFKLNYLETLTGFTNGVLLLGIVSGIFVEAIERCFFNPIAIEGTNELLVVAVLGLLVNLVGLFSMEHNANDSENMRGIFLHILADTLGSVGVIVSTILIKFTGWYIFDPIASLFIGILILASSIPLLKSTSASILLKLDDKNHNIIKDVLNQISTTPGVAGYTTPRFWPYKLYSQGHSHAHGHSHGHDQEHPIGKHEHEHEHGHEHSHQQEEHHDHDDACMDSPEKKLIGYIHVQYVEGENSTILKKRVEKILERAGIKAWIQVESPTANCWCRPASANQVIVPQTVQT
ncbi:metal cation transporter MSC2 KNAG_0A04570 [Huiozyma naganishii CBS 8797]|uniref:Zinc transporter n=1 Tax=Huiozyma naganishii (strain ATCC MYA-139 / BCRC 22969 / CBS 8797 / KCTC 17520 / NBRC 10181 / NCYC 3082 / Yp74L-3) TaxID=1071383 RepID=J7S2E4_HUIN7|nr:hypothetical protein KNAG_0A04570 [Kazachstania naganishii CBS 8797]CCK68129.1 hypothetical protein KNAG_0A04570 [Kazachstania naganishii CBS 8797]